MNRIPTNRARARLPEALRRVTRDGERLVFSRNGKDVAALVPVGDLKLLEEIEDRADVEAARAALAEMKRKGEKPIPYEKVRKELGLR